MKAVITPTIEFCPLTHTVYPLCNHPGHHYHVVDVDSLMDVVLGKDNPILTTKLSTLILFEAYFDEAVVEAMVSLGLKLIVPKGKDNLYVDHKCVPLFVKFATKLAKRAIAKNMIALLRARISKGERHENI